MLAARIAVRRIPCSNNSESIARWSRTGLEELVVLEARGVELPDLVKRVLAAKPSYLCGSLEEGPLSVSFNLGSADSVTAIWATVGGERAMGEEVLAKLRRPGWVLVSPEPLSVQQVGSGDVLNLTGGATLLSEKP
jgi:hypothetical protein